MKYPLTSKIGLLILGFAAHLSGCAADGYETWKTEISCQQQHFSITSFCQPSGNAEKMNSCKSEQILKKEGFRSITLPLPDTRAINQRLRAAFWECQKVGTEGYLKIEYVAGLGNNEDEEAIEFFDMSLAPVTDKKIRKKIIQNGQNDGDGRIRSILPE